MQDKQYDLAIVDPPYGINVNINMGRRAGERRSSYHKYAGGDADRPCNDFFRLLRTKSKNQIIWGGNYFADLLPATKCWLVWDKLFSQDVSFAQCELAWTSFNVVASIYKLSSQQSIRIHPTQKPVALYKWILTNYAKTGQSILDTHGGSGSICIACYDLGFDLDWYELDKEYYDKACERFERHKQQQRFL